MGGGCGGGVFGGNLSRRKKTAIDTFYGCGVVVSWRCGNKNNFDQYDGWGVVEVLKKNFDDMSDAWERGRRSKTQGEGSW